MNPGLFFAATSLVLGFKEGAHEAAEKAPLPPGTVACVIQPQIPLADFAKTAKFGVGLQFAIDYPVAEDVALTGGLGATNYFVKVKNGGLTNIPLSGGLRYAFAATNNGGYLAGGIDINVLVASDDYVAILARSSTIAESSYTTATFGLSAGFGYRIDRLDLGARLQTLDVGQLEKSLQLGLHVGYHFVDL